MLAKLIEQPPPAVCSLQYRLTVKDPVLLKLSILNLN